MEVLIFLGSWFVGSMALVGLLFIWLLPAMLFASMVQGVVNFIFGRRDKSNENNG